MDEVSQEKTNHRRLGTADSRNPWINLAYTFSTIGHHPTLPRPLPFRPPSQRPCFLIRRTNIGAANCLAHEGRGWIASATSCFTRKTYTSSAGYAQPRLWFRFNHPSTLLMSSVGELGPADSDRQHHRRPLPRLSLRP